MCSTLVHTMGFSKSLLAAGLPHVALLVAAKQLLRCAHWNQVQDLVSGSLHGHWRS